MGEEKHLQIVVILLAILTLAFTAAGGILTIWGLDSLYKLEEQIKLQVQRIVHGEKEKTQKIFRHYSDVFVSEILMEHWYLKSLMIREFNLMQNLRKNAVLEESFKGSGGIKIPGNSAVPNADKPLRLGCKDFHPVGADILPFDQMYGCYQDQRDEMLPDDRNLFLKEYAKLIVRDDGTKRISRGRKIGKNDFLFKAKESLEFYEKTYNIRLSDDYARAAGKLHEELCGFYHGRFKRSWDKMDLEEAIENCGKSLSWKFSASAFSDRFLAIYTYWDYYDLRDNDDPEVVDAIKRDIKNTEMRLFFKYLDKLEDSNKSKIDKTHPMIKKILPKIPSWRNDFLEQLEKNH